MIAVVVNYDLEPLRCSTCGGTGAVDHVDYWKDRTTFYTFTGEYPKKPCRVCDGTGRHVSRARAGLAAPPTVCAAA